MSRLKRAPYDEAVAYDSDSDCSEDEFDSCSEVSSSPCGQARELVVAPTFKGCVRPPPRFRKPTGRPRRFEPMDTMSSTTNSSVLSSLETTEDTTETDPSDLYTPISRKRQPMIMEHEISPVLSDTIEPMPPRLRLHREWNPKHTSTTTDMQPLFKLPKTNPHFTPSLSTSTPIRSRMPVLTTYNQVMNMPPTSRPPSYYDVENDPNLVWDNRRPHSSSVRAVDDFNCGYYRADHFKIPAVLAKNKGITGILFMAMSIGGPDLIVKVRHAFYFSESRQLPFSSYVKLEMKNRHRKRQTSHSSRPSRHNEATATERTQIVHCTNKPDFRATFTFPLDLGRDRNHQELFVRVYVVEGKTSKKMLGCMTFPISRMLEKASRDARTAYYKNDSTVEEIIINDEGFFLMDAKHGEKNNLPQHKVRLKEFYDDPALSGSCGMTTSSYSSSNLTSSRQMPMEEFVTASRQFGSSMIPGYSSAAGERPMDNSSASSSSSYPHYNGRHRFTLPTITTSDSSEHDGYSGVSCQPPQEMDHHLYADDNMNERKFRRGGSPSPTPNAKHVRRATSFTFSPKDSVDKYNRRAPQVNKEKEEGKKKTGPLAKMFSLLRNSKKESSLSSSSLYLSRDNCPSKEEVYEWEHNFEKLLAHEVGNQLFRSFLIKEHSEENLDFWTACEEFKRMKEGDSKMIKRAQEIYKKYVEADSPNQVNLDFDTRKATKAEMESGIDSKTFGLAQVKIEQLMKTDTYKRFLQDALFIDLKLAVAVDQQRPTSTPNEA